MSHFYDFNDTPIKAGSPNTRVVFDNTKSFFKQSMNPFYEETTEEREEFLRNVKVEDIHNEFLGASEKLLKEAEEILKAKDEETENYAKLYELGFRQHQKAMVAASRVTTDKMIIRVAEKAKYYQQKYPLYKFIDQASVEKICVKYNLIIGSPLNFIGEIPLKNLKEMTSFKIKDEDVILKNFNLMPFENNEVFKTLKDAKEFGRTMFKEMKEDEVIKKLKENSFKMDEVIFGLETFTICATENNFDMRGYRLQGKNIVSVNNDPIILQPVEMGYLIVTAWGDEASDEKVANEKMN